MNVRQIHTVLGLLALFVCSLAGVSLAQQANSDWEEIELDEGIRVLKRDIPGQELPAFRGETVIQAPVDKLVAVLKDYTHHKDWMHRCVEGNQIKDLGNGRSIDYNRTDAPWPVWDRDVILEAAWSTSTDGKLVTLEFKNTDPKLRPLPDKTVRMPRLVGFYKFWQLGPDRTKVVYQVEADPGGSLPTWLAKSVARDLPFNTLASLRARVTGKH